MSATSTTIGTNVLSYRQLLKRGVSLASLALTFMSGVAHAQDRAVASAPDGIEDIVVTAQKTAELLSKTPVTMSALSAEELGLRGYTSIDNFAGAVPGLQVQVYDGSLRTNIRGIGPNNLSVGNEGQIAFNLNGVYLGQSFGAAQAFLDVDR